MLRKRLVRYAQRFLIFLIFVFIPRVSLRDEAMPSEQEIFLDRKPFVHFFHSNFNGHYGKAYDFRPCSRSYYCDILLPRFCYMLPV